MVLIDGADGKENLDDGVGDKCSMEDATDELDNTDDLGCG